MTTSTELHRYIEYLQRQLLTEGLEESFDHSRHVDWWKSERGSRRIMSSYPGHYSSGLIAEYEQLVVNFKPSTQFETVSVSGIFRPILDEVVHIASGLGLALDRDLSLASSTSSSPGAFSWPSAEHHILFVGPGTSSFCNYWAKAFSAIITTLSLHSDGKSMGREFVLERLQANPSLLFLPTRLAAYQALAGTLIGFGDVPVSKHFNAYRMELLQAMEVFVVAHEYGHFVAEERFEKFRGALTPDATLEMETFCDRFGMSICQAYGAKHDNFLAYSGAGPMLLFQCMTLGDIAREELALDRCDGEDGHPEHTKRITVIEKQAVLGAPEDQKKMVSSFMKEFGIICDAVEEAVRGIFERVTQN